MDPEDSNKLPVLPSPRTGAVATVTAPVLPDVDVPELNTRDPDVEEKNHVSPVVTATSPDDVCTVPDCKVTAPEEPAPTAEPEARVT